jgi:hypothetical protein
MPVHFPVRVRHTETQAVPLQCQGRAMFEDDDKVMRQATAVSSEVITCM